MSDGESRGKKPTRVKSGGMPTSVPESGQVDLTNGLRAYYPFSGNAQDASGNNNNPVFNNATLTADRFGKPGSAYHFNGIDNYMKILNSPSLNLNKLGSSFDFQFAK